jgi:hypothetical protein
VSKLSSWLVTVLLVAGIGYLIHNPSAANSGWNWVCSQLGIDRVDMKKMGTPSYMPITPAKGL